jgi:hypothetical protein
MNKKRASAETVYAFVKAVYPDSTKLCITTNGEEEILRDATELIAELREMALPVEQRAAFVAGWLSGLRWITDLNESAERVKAEAEALRRYPEKPQAGGKEEG